MTFKCKTSSLSAEANFFSTIFKARDLSVVVIRLLHWQPNDVGCHNRNNAIVVDTFLQMVRQTSLTRLVTFLSPEDDSEHIRRRFVIVI